MKTVRVYKDNMREHILRSLFFTDTVLFVGGGIVLAVCILILYKFVFHVFDTGLYLATIITVEVLYAIAITFPIDKQPMYKIIPRVIRFTFSRKRYAMQQLDSTTADFRIVDRYIIRRKRMISVYEVRPFDIALLNDEDREQFYLKVKTMLHTLPGKVQFVVRKEIAKVADYHDHFFSIYKDSEKKRQELIENYVTDITNLLETERFQMVKYYAVFSTQLPTEKEDDFIAARKRLYDNEVRLASSLQVANIGIRHLANDELVRYMQTQIRNI